MGSTTANLDRMPVLVTYKVCSEDCSEGGLLEKEYLQHSVNLKANLKNILVCCLPTDSPVGERGGSVVECRTPEREVRGSRPTAAVLCP